MFVCGGWDRWRPGNMRLQFGTMRVQTPRNGTAVLSVQRRNLQPDGGQPVWVPGLRLQQRGLPKQRLQQS